VGIAIYQLKALFKGWGNPSYKFNLIKGTLHNLRKKCSRICEAEQYQIVLKMLDAAIFFRPSNPYQGAI